MKDEKAIAIRTDIAAAINKHSLENGSNTPDFILAGFLADCLSAFGKAAQRRDEWYGERQPAPIPVEVEAKASLPPHQQRVVDEKRDLDEKLVKLTAFFDNPIFAGLDDGEQSRLRQQAHAMTAYSNILSDRIAFFV